MQTSTISPVLTRPTSQSDSRHEPAGWALLFVALATVGQGLVAGGLLATQGLAMLLGVALTLAGGPVLAWVGFGAPSRRWPAAVQGLVAAVVAALGTVGALLFMSGVDPFGFATL